MTYLIEKDSGKFRNHGEAVYDGDVEIFMAPSHKLVPTLMDNLFNWMNEVKDTINPFILSSVFHYEFVFIHHIQETENLQIQKGEEILMLYTCYSVKNMKKHHIDMLFMQRKCRRKILSIILDNFM